MTDFSVSNIVEKTGVTPEEARAHIVSLSPQQRLIRPEEIAHVALMLAGDDGDSINGDTIVLGSSRLGGGGSEGTISGRRGRAARLEDFECGKLADALECLRVAAAGFSDNNLFRRGDEPPVSESALGAMRRGYPAHNRGARDGSIHRW